MMHNNIFIYLKTNDEGTVPYTFPFHFHLSKSLNVYQNEVVDLKRLKRREVGDFLYLAVFKRSFRIENRYTSPSPNLLTSPQLR